MNRLTHERMNGIKTGAWSPNKKQELVDRLAAYERTGLEPEEVLTALQINKNLVEQLERRWIPGEERLLKDDHYILLSFENFDIPMIGRYEEDEEGGAFYAGDDDAPCVSAGLFVNAWQPLPKPYRPQHLTETGEEQLQDGGSGYEKS